jgi:hypothetical protein
LQRALPPGGLSADVDLVVVQSLSHSHRPFRRGDRAQQRLGRPTLTQIATSASRRPEQANAAPEADPLRRRTLGFVTNQAYAGLLFANCALR